jgi:tetrahydromethanopterin S-methyltransferase subunit F
MGAEAIKELLMQVDLQSEVDAIKEEIENIKDSSSQREN